MNKKKSVTKKSKLNKISTKKNNVDKNKLIRISIIFSITIIIVLLALLVLFITKKDNVDIANDQIFSIEEMIGKTANKKVLKIQDSNGDIFYLPKGFKISENTEEQVVKKGVVIIDNTRDEETSGSEFVWIPVDNIDICNIKELKYRTLDYTMLKENNTTEEYKNIQKSISTYGGFYVSRYEAGISKKMEQKLSKLNLFENQTITQDTTEEFANGKYKPVSKSDVTVWNFIKWGGTLEEKSSDGMSGNDKENGAVKVSRNMYNSFKTSVKSNLCYGFQWEAIMNFIDSCYFDNECEDNSVIIDSSNYGSYDTKLSKTASNDVYKQKNIYDLAGNVWEWTMTGYSNLYRIARGGSYCVRGDFYPISSEKEFYPSDYYKEIGFRVALWID